MQRTLFHLPIEINGIPIFGLGILLGIWLIVSIAVVAWTVRREGWQGVPTILATLGIVGLVIGIVIPAVAEEHGVPIRGYGMMMLIGIILSVALACYRAKRRGLAAEVIFSATLWMFIPGILGARLFHVIEYWNETYWPVFQTVSAHAGTMAGIRSLIGTIINVTAGGLVVYGSMIGGIVGLLLFVRKNRFRILSFADILAPSLMLGLALGRVGCLLNGCCYGGICPDDFRFAVRFPQESPPYQSQVQRGLFYGIQLSGDKNAPPILLAVDPDSEAAQHGWQAGDRIERIAGIEVINTGDVQYQLEKSFREHFPIEIVSAQRGAVTLHPPEPIPERSLPVHPTQIYSMLNALAICLFLIAFTPMARKDGQVFAMILTIYPITRFLLEAIRTDESAIFGTGLSISQNVSLLLLLLAAILWWRLSRTQPGITHYKAETSKDKSPESSC